MDRVSSTVLRCTFVLSVAASLACTETDDGGGGGVPQHYEVWIDATDSTTTHSIVDLYGVATCDACPPAESLFGTCPPIQGPFSSAIGIEWANLTTGGSGAAFHGIYGHQSWFFSYCTVSYSHRWSASIPLDFGLNELELIATGPSLQPGTDTRTITRVPAAPQGVVAQAGPIGVTLSWDAVAGAESYELLWSSEPNLSLPTTQVIAGVTSPYLHSGAANQVRYYAVRAVTRGYSGPLSEVVFATAGWIPETIPLPALYFSAADFALAIDSAGQAHVHVSRLGTIANPVIDNDYATNAGGAWSAVHVADASDLAADLALDSGDGVHVTYTMTAGRHVVLVGGAWVEDNFDSHAACYTSLALDAQDRPHVLYVQQQFTPVQTGLVKYASRASGAWVSEVVDTTLLGCYQEGSKLALALDGTSQAHALYLAGPTEIGLRYATNATGTWVSESVTSNWIRCLALALDAGGTPHALWTDDSNNLLHAVRQGAGNWPAESLDSYCFGPSLAIEPDGDLHVSYLQYALDQLRYAKRSAGLWEVLPVAAASWSPSALALDAQGHVHIAYFDGADAKYVTNR